MAKELLFHDEAREALLEGAGKLARAVKETMGPQGRTVAIDRGWGAPNITKDGETVADEIELESPYENMGARMLKEAAEKTSDDAGDGTTTAIVLTEAIYREGYKAVAAGADPMAIQRGLQKALHAAVTQLENIAVSIKTKTDKIGQIAEVAANHDTTIGSLIAEAFKRVGADGVVTIDESKGIDTTIDVVEGMQFDRGYLAPQFVNDTDNVRVELDDPYILIHEEKLTDGRKLINLLEQISKSKRPILIIAENVEDQALSTLVVNTVRGNLQACAVKAPGYGQRRKAILEDLAALTGAQPLFKDLAIDIESVGLEILGTAKKVIVDSDNTTLIEGAGKSAAVKARIASIRNELERTTSDYDREKLEERLAKLAGGVAEIQVGAKSEIELKEKKQRAENALSAAKAAIAEGIVPGGGVALLHCRDAVSALTLSGDESFGVQVLANAMSAPFLQIAANADVDGPSKLRLVEKAKAKAAGYNASTDTVEDLIKAGIVDPAKVVRLALTNAVSTAGIMLTTEVVISEEPEEEEDHHHHGHDHGMPGMM
jgi:chaperonin GroEL